ncbi:hypothetical protein Fleli_3598 [Bernardetia litoralis DSM 6794]|uniref:Protein FecR C-terminal domain-containing protein n=1 Tax=Bernardetia litoralis (strain ATCC 23117 / DSM 6794 / NBRC 15988 / NCIMB 1366 / Fx l1 / Sio-4) TaxID=880071 RepID=I4APN1_BERLS|nr:DUF4974 domain-containing protein [Bernardetia litoralis]AFM05916.1 hypothetical protein Fleli_3598 [Bernardetia litoralis DSM 6794]
MKNYFFFILTFLCLYFTFGFENTLLAQTNSKKVLEQPVTLFAQNKTLENIFSDLSKKYNVRFSYSNSRLPLQRKINIKVSNIPLKDVLNQIFEPLNDDNTQIQFRLINGQIVIQAKSNSLENNIKEAEKPQIASLPKKPLIIDKKDKTSKTASVSTKENEINGKNEIELIENNEIIDSLEKTSELLKIDSIEKRNTENQLLDSSKIAKVDSLSKEENNKKEISILSKLDSIPLQVTFVYPLGTNGSESYSKNNRVSLNILAGYNGGLNGLEIGGVTNILKKDMRGIQLSGFANIVDGKTTGFQAAGFANITKDSVSAFQSAGFINLVKSDFTGFQVAGFTNIVTKNVKGVQAAGFMNVAKESVNGVQISSFNLAKNIKGVQIGIFNKADTIKGSQIGIINIADSITGVPIGLINFIKNGYHSFEISGSEGFHTALSYNTGVNKFYQIFSAGVQFDDKTRWGLGFGLGTRFPITKNKKQRTHAGFELMAYHIHEEKWTNKLNLLSQFKFKIHHQISKEVGIFIAPTLNVMVSQIYNTENNTVGSNFAPYSFIEDTTTNSNPYNNRTTNTKVWAGGFIGISF